MNLHAELRRETDVLVVGGGGAAVTAALGAAESGVRVLLVSKGQVGNSGNTIMIGGSFAMDGESARHRYGIEEADPGFTKRVLYESILKDGFFINDQNMVEQFVEESPPIVFRVVQWAQAAGDPFLFVPPAGWWMSGRMMGKALLHGLASRPDIETLSDVVVLELLRDGERVCGALALDVASGRFMRIHAKAVVLGTGGFQPFSLKNTNSDMTGDGIAMAYRAGASVADMEFLLFLMSALEPDDIAGSILPIMLVTNPSFRYVATDRHGNELGMPPALKELETRSEICKLLHIVYYGKAVAGEARTDRGGIYLKLLGTDEEIDRAFDETVDLFRKFYREGFYHSDDINKVRRMCLRTRRWEVGLVNEYSLGGILVDETMRTTLPGLFAAGECACGVFGANRVADAVTEMLVQGNRAGISAADYTKTIHGGPESDLRGDGSTERIMHAFGRREGPLVNETTARFEAISDADLNCYRTESGLASALDGYRNLEQDLDRARILEPDMRCNVEFLGYVALQNRLVCAGLSALMARARKESRGLHLRLDYPEIDDEHYLVRFVARRGTDGPELSSRPPLPGTMPLPPPGRMPYERYLLETGIGLENL